MKRILLTEEQLSELLTLVAEDRQQKRAHGNEFPRDRSGRMLLLLASVFDDNGYATGPTLLLEPEA